LFVVVSRGAAPVPAEEEMAMSSLYVSGAAWQLPTMSEAQRRAADEANGRLAAGWSRGWRRILHRRG
jgi:hypothetical protein